MMQRLVLASASPRRREILARLGVPFDVVATSTPEQPRAGELPAAVATRLAREKAAAAAKQAPGAVIVAADTVVVLDGQILGKPADTAEARSMLRRLRGRTHEVITGVVVDNTATGQRASQAVTTRVTMRAYSDAEIDAYVARGDPLDKAGAYAIQDTAFHPVAHIEGCYYNVVGLPLCVTARLLQKVGFPLPADAVKWTTTDPGGPCACVATWAVAEQEGSRKPPHG